MKISFNIDYETVFGEEILLNVVERVKNVKDKLSQFRMNNVHGKHWWYDLNKTASAQNTVIDYFYSVDCDGSEKRHEWFTQPHRLELNANNGKSYKVFDRWIDIPEDSYLYSSAFTECVNKRKLSAPISSNYSKTIRLIVRAPQLRDNKSLAIVGKANCIGAWDVFKAVPMCEHNYNEWVVDIDASALKDNKLEFKFAAIDKDDNKDTLWETGFNREIEIEELHDGDVAVYYLDQAFFELSDIKLAGTLVPVFSLRSDTSFGIGDFGDLKKTIDWVSSINQRVLQVLPINDTTITHTWTDSYPYSCISIFALHPQYVDLTLLPKIKDAKKSAE